MVCENCNCEHNGEYGSGRFCSSKCARSFSTNRNREEINKKVSESLRGRESWVPKEHRRGFSKEQQIKGGLVSAQKIREKVLRLWREEGKLCKNAIKDMILKEQNCRFSICGIEPMWNGKPMIFILDHIDGDNENNSRENLRLVCSNCDSQLPTYKNKNKNRNKDSQNKRYFTRRKHQIED